VAQRLFSQVADADPRNAIAIVGLARVAARRGDSQGAVDLARRALALDPQEAAARRLVAELDAAPVTPVVPEAPVVPARSGWRQWLARLFGRR
jgi:hypothetical protein